MAGVTPKPYVPAIPDLPGTTHEQAVTVKSSGATVAQSRFTVADLVQDDFAR